MSKSAIISQCGTYRYLLQRGDHTGGNACAVVMLNPSTADATVDDPTIRRLIGFAQDWGFRGLTVANLYAGRATDPKDLWKIRDPIGPENDGYLQMVAHYPLVVVAWGSNAERARADAVMKILSASGKQPQCLGTNANGMPKHPLYVPRATQLRPY